MNCIDRLVVLKILAKFNIIPGDKDENTILKCEKIVHEYGDEIEYILIKDYEQKFDVFISQIENLEDELVDLKFPD